MGRTRAQRGAGPAVAGLLAYGVLFAAFGAPPWMGILGLLPAALTAWRHGARIGAAAGGLVLALNCGGTALIRPDELWDYLSSPATWLGHGVLIGLAYLLGSLFRLQRTLRVQMGERAAVLSALSERERQLAEARRSETVARLAGGIAHDFNNQLTSIIGLGEMLRDDLDSPHREDAEEILAAAGRARLLTDRLLAIGRRRLLQPDALDLNAEVQRFATERGAQAGQRLTVDVTDGRLPVRLDRAALDQMLAALVENALDATSPGQPVTLRTRRGGDAQRPVAELAVVDEGSGMDAEVRARATEPCFSTKGGTHTTGFGLAVTEGLATQSGGLLQITSSADSGCTAALSFPLAPEGSPDGQTLPLTPSSVPLTDAPAILVAEDDPAVRGLTRRILTRAGYEVITAQDGALALQILQAGHTVDLLLTDVAMPNMTGPELAQHATELRPKLPVLFMSGYVGDLLQPEHGPARHALSKPFGPAELVAAVRACMED